MNKTIFYLMSGPAHLPYLVVSLDSLRNHWDGKVVVYAWPESIGIVEHIAQDERLAIEPVEWKPDRTGRNAQFECKIQIAQTIECDVGLYLDADTMIQGNLDRLFDEADDYGFVATQFNDWTTHDRLVPGRIKGMRQFPEIDQDAVEELINHDYFSVNGGIWAFKPSSPVLPKWYEWTCLARPIFISDETVLHVMQIIFRKGEFYTLSGGDYNCSCKFQPKHLKDEDVVIRHFHGNCNTKWSKSQRGVKIWYPHFYRCLRSNVGNIRDWIGKIRNKNMDKTAELIQDGTIIIGDDHG